MAKKPRWGKELTRLLEPVGVDDFLKNYWARRSLHLAGARDRFKPLFDKRRFWKALQTLDRQGLASRGLIRAHWGTVKPDDGSDDVFSRVDTPRAKKALARGASLCVNVISDGDPGLYAFAQAIKRQLGYPGTVRFNAYYSPHEGGLPVHFDARVAWVIQISGSKHWWCTREPSVDWPRTNADRLEDGSALYIDGQPGAKAWELARATRGDDFEEVLLEPGDCLILPAGTWHAAGAEKESLALTLCFDPVSPLAILYEELEQRLGADPKWRACEPMRSGGGAVLARHGRELIGAVERVAADAARLQKAWDELVES
jgi:ribosomal protein L16 Arg81 hydroxylase